MADTFRSAVLGRTGLNIGRLGMASSYGAGEEDVEYAFERGVNYFMWALWRRASFGRGLSNLCRRDRDRVKVVLASFMRPAALAERSLMKGLRDLGLEYADVLLLGMHNKKPKGRMLEMAVRLKEKGLFRHIGLSTHRRLLVAELAADPNNPFDVVQLRYNASHRGAETEVFPKLPKDGGPGIVAFTATGPRKLLRRPGRLAASDPTPTATDCYRFVLTEPAIDCCLCGPKDRVQLDAALAALDRGPMSEDEIRWMRRVGDLVHSRLPI